MRLNFSLKKVTKSGVTIIKGDELKKYVSEYVRKNFSRDRLA